MIDSFTWIDWTAASGFLLSWVGLSWLLDHSPWRDKTLSAAMNRHRRRWMEVMSMRELRMIDTNIIAGLQNGTAFFASASLLAIGAALTLLSGSDQVLNVVRDLALEPSLTRGEWETKTLGLVGIYAYAFFKFAWAYRLFNYASILIGTTPPAAQRDTPEAHSAVGRAADLNIMAGHHFSLGLRAFFFSVGYMGWFANAWIWMALTATVVLVLIRRQFASVALRTARVAVI